MEMFGFTATSECEMQTYFIFVKNLTFFGWWGTCSVLSFRGTYYKFAFWLWWVFLEFSNFLELPENFWYLTMNANCSAYFDEQIFKYCQYIVAKCRLYFIMFMGNGYEMKKNEEIPLKLWLLFSVAFIWIMWHSASVFLFKIVV